MYSVLFNSLCFAALGGLGYLASLQVGISVASQIGYLCIAAIVALAIFPGKTSRLFFVTICAWTVVRYLMWRFTSLPLDNGPLAGSVASLLLFAECYGSAMMLLGLFVNAYPLERTPPKLPREEELPTVDVYIPTYSEPLSIVAPTVMGAMNIRYPKSKVNVYVLDDGFPRSRTTEDREQARELASRAEALKKLCERHGATYLTRNNNEHAKSGNLNAAMKHTKGELILVLDADHVPTVDILENTVGFFLKDEKLAFVQTPHFFLNGDPVEKNLDMLNKMPGENDMFYRVVQKGLDLWNTSFFCGSAALISRKAVRDVDGFSHESITEDASTSVKMHQKGWRSAYYGKPMVSGLQPETFAGFIVQRLRWGMGMAQIMMKQNPLFIGGLSLSQRLSYFSVVLFWLFPIARIIFFLSPLFSLFMEEPIYPTGFEYFYAYTIPYLIAVVVSTERTFGRVRRILLSEVYETLQAFYTLPALISTILSPNSPTFKVTPKGERLDEEFISEFRTPFYVFTAITLVGLFYGIYRMVTEPDVRSSLWLSVSWLGFNTVLLAAALGTLLEKVQRRRRPRAVINEPITLINSAGTEIEGSVVDASNMGILVKVYDSDADLGEPLEMKTEFSELRLPLKVLHSRKATLREGYFAANYQEMSPEQERLAVHLAYGSSSRWEQIWKKREASLNSPMAVLQFTIVAINKAFKHLGHLHKTG